MKKNIILIAIVLILAAGAVWLASKKPVSQPISENPGAGDNAATTTDSQTNNGGSTNPAVDGNKTKAFEILDKEFVFKTDIPENDKQKITAKLNELADLLKKNYKYFEAWIDFGNYKKLGGDYTGAIEAWKFASIINSVNAVPYHNLGDVYTFTLRNYSEGEKYFLKSISVAPGNTDAYVQLATIYQYLDLSKSDQVESILLKGVNANTGSPTLRVRLADYYLEKGDKVNALKYYEEAFLLDPANKALEQQVAELKAAL
ncbi:MAG: hypothetical protein PHP03_00550 [Candidatus Pacebacteria bacterium]|nr:hypothetical protein [Candidatus Paceibacterota bacterium]